MQEITDLWHQVKSWAGSFELPHVQLSDVGNSIWELSLWLNTGYRGMTIALVLLVIIVNRILKRTH